MWALTLFLRPFKKFDSFLKKSTKSERQRVIKRTLFHFTGTNIKPFF
jgi:hypothetical protein